MHCEEAQDTKNELKCTYCGKQFKYDSERKRHEQSHTPQFDCKICKKKFSFISALRRHEKQHERKGSVICSECNRKFRDDILLKRHIKYAHKGTFTCTKCDRKFNSDMALRTHMKTHKPESERRFRCNACNKSFNFQHHLKHHEMTHTDTKQHFCNICGKGFIQFHHLKTHLKSHDPGDWLECSVTDCNKRFSTEYSRKRHLLTHRIKLDSGISSDSSSTCDVTDVEVKGHNWHTPEPYTPDQDVKTANALECSKDVELNEQVTTNASRNEECSPENTQDYSREEDKIEHTFRSCKTVLGGCIMSHNGEINENCLCAQISSSAVEECNVTPEDVDKGILMPQKETSKSGNMLDFNIENFCEVCECGSNVNASVPLNLTNSTNLKCPKAGIKDAMPELEYRKDGTIKIKETFDIDIESDSIETDFDIGLFPYSCKSVLGKCIVSGNGTIGDGCFCAKMAMQNSINAEEIDEITPHPKEI